MEYIKIYVVLFTLVNAVALGMMIWDKFNAIKNKRRLSEKTLLLFSVIGGALGMLIGMVLVSHKTAKVHFKYVVPISALVHWFLIITWFFKVS